jgi:predicted flap endonuclease-1-like 5' DNA nuclease
MNWMWFGIGLAAGLLVFWIIYLSVLRRGWRRVALDLRARAESAEQETSALKEQLLLSQQEAEARLDAAQAEISSLQEQFTALQSAPVTPEGVNADLDAARAEVAKLKGVQTRLDSANSQLTSVRAELATMKDAQERMASATYELDAVKARLACMVDAEAQLATAKAELSALRARLSAAEAAAAAAGAEQAEPDNYKVIEGIGPKIDALLHENGLRSYAQLAMADEERLRGILRSAGSRYGAADPGTWPRQAALARDGQMEALKALQATLKGERAV